MTDTNVIKLAQPGTFTDSLTEILRNGARALLTQAVETEVTDFLRRTSDRKLKPRPLDPARHQDLAIALATAHGKCVVGSALRYTDITQARRNF